MVLAPAVELFLRDLESGAEVKSEAIATLSDLDREAATAVRARWPSIPPDRRVWAMEQAVERFLTRIEVDFSRLGLIALGDGEERVRLAAVLALSESDTRETAEELVRTAMEDPVDDVREAAASELGRFVLMAELGTFSRALGDRIESTLRGLAGDADGSVELRAAAIEALGPSTKPWVEALLTEAYYSDSKDIRLAAVTAMGRSADEMWLEFVIEQLHSDDPEFRTEAANACAEISSPAALDELTGLLVDDDPDVVFATLAAIGDIGGSEAVAILDEFKLNADEDLYEAIELARREASEVKPSTTPDDGGGDW